jgi:hypothetical protein
MLSGTSDCAGAVDGGGATVAVAAADLADLFFAVFFVVFFAVFLAAFFAVFFVDFVVFADFVVLADFLPPFFVDFLAAFTAFFAPPRDFDFDALFFVPFPAPLRAPLDFLVPFLAAIAFTPFKFLSLAHRSKIISDCPRCFSFSWYKANNKTREQFQPIKNQDLCRHHSLFGLH